MVKVRSSGFFAFSSQLLILIAIEATHIISLISISFPHIYSARFPYFDDVKKVIRLQHNLWHATKHKVLLCNCMATYVCLNDECLFSFTFVCICYMFHFPQVSDPFNKLLCPLCKQSTLFSRIFGLILITNINNAYLAKRNAYTFFKERFVII